QHFRPINRPADCAAPESRAAPVDEIDAPLRDERDDDELLRRPCQTERGAAQSLFHVRKRDDGVAGPFDECEHGLTPALRERRLAAFERQRTVAFERETKRQRELLDETLRVGFGYDAKHALAEVRGVGLVQIRVEARVLREAGGERRVEEGGEEGGERRRGL